jgi:hypothetical protein
MVEKFPELCRTRMFIIVFIKLRLWSLDEPSESSPLRIIFSHNIHINLSFHLCLSPASGLFDEGFLAGNTRFSLVRSTFATSLLFLNFITLTILVTDTEHEASLSAVFPNLLK